jgi:ABC-2 type transport system ATP-binding protein
VHRRKRVTTAVMLVVALVAGGLALGLTRGADPVAETALRVPVGAEPTGSSVSLDASVFRPAGTGPFPAVLLAHGFGGSKNDQTADARYLAQHGFLALTWTARGFGRSTGRIHLDAPAYEVKDASRLVDLLGARSDVVKDGAGDPRVAVVGGSYGGALALLLAGSDRRVDALSPQITWNDLGQALFPQFAATDAFRATPAGVQPIAPTGVFKKVWAGLLFSAGAGNSSCGRFDPTVCAEYQRSAAAGVPTPGLAALLRASSPASVLDRITAPTLLVQGEADSLFPLSEGDANARGIAAHGTPVHVVWFGGGHDGGVAETDRLRTLTLTWLERWLLRRAVPTGPAFQASVVMPSQDGSPDTVTVRTAPALPGVTTGTTPGQSRIALTGPTQRAVAPAAGTPAAITNLPGLGALGRAASGLGGAFSPPGQAAVFQSAPLEAPLRLVGAPSVDLSVRSTAGDATLFAALYDDPGGGQAATLPEQLVSPVRLPVGPGGTVAHVVLPAVVHDFAAGHRLRLVVSTTDQAYALPADARTYQLSLAGAGALSLPVVPTSAGGGGSGRLVAAAVALAALLLVGLAIAAGLSRRRRHAPPDPELAEVPLVIDGLVKTYGGAFRAVSDLSFRVERGQVLGLLGPNGAGKTTAVRVMLGLLRPTAGQVRIFGFPAVAGAPVLSRVGAFVEGPGLVPHLTGRENLELYWRATGRPADDAHLAEALEVAGLDEDLTRKVRTYSQGMRQRLAIAQAMLGLPELLILDEPTNGLDPPQIREMRDVLGRYAATGRTVVVSSHLLSEVEQTCSHVVVMHHGRLVAQGPVAELVGAATSVLLDVDDVDLAVRVTEQVPGTQDIRRTPTGLSLRLVGTPRAELLRRLVEAGVGVERLAPQRGLEEAFLSLVGED